MINELLFGLPDWQWLRSWNCCAPLLQAQDVCMRWSVEHVTSLQNSIQAMVYIIILTPTNVLCNMNTVLQKTCGHIRCYSQSLREWKNDAKKWNCMCWWKNEFYPTPSNFQQIIIKIALLRFTLQNHCICMDFWWTGNSQIVAHMQWFHHTAEALCWHHTTHDFLAQLNRYHPSNTTMKTPQDLLALWTKLITTQYQE